MPTLAFGPKTNTLLSGDTTGSMRIWDVNSQKQLHATVGHDKTVYSSAFHPSLPLAATGCAAGRICVWDTNTGKATHTIETGARINGMLFLGEDRLLAAGIKGLVEWDFVNGTSRRPFEASNDAMFFMAVHPDGKRIAASTKTNVRIWNLKSHKLVATLAGTVYPMTFHGKLPWLATGNGQGKVTLWNLNTGKQLQTLRAHKGAIKAVTFSPDGGTLATGGDDKLVRLWQVGTGGSL